MRISAMAVLLSLTGCATPQCRPFQRLHGERCICEVDRTSTRYPCEVREEHGRLEACAVVPPLARVRVGCVGAVAGRELSMEQ